MSDNQELSALDKERELGATKKNVRSLVSAHPMLVWTVFGLILVFLPPIGANLQIVTAVLLFGVVGELMHQRRLLHDMKKKLDEPSTTARTD